MNPISDILVLDFCDWLTLQIRLNARYENGLDLLLDDKLELYAEEYLRLREPKDIKDVLAQFIQSDEFNRVLYHCVEYRRDFHLTPEELMDIIICNGYELQGAFREFYCHYRPERINAYELARHTKKELQYSESPYILQLMSGLTNSISVELDFIEWLSKNDKKGILKNIPSDVYEHLVDAYVSERGKDINEKRKLLRVYQQTGWKRFLEQAQKVIFNRRNPKDLNYVIKRYLSHAARYNCVILPLSDSESQKQFRMLISDYWDNLNDLSGDYLDIYYSESDLEKTGYDIADRLSSLPEELKKSAPCLVLWKNNMKEAQAISIEGLSCDQVFSVVKEIVQDIYGTGNAEEDILEELVKKARKVAEEKRKENLAGIHILNEGTYIQKGDIVGGNINN